jgi:ATP-dependent DNA helicase 2 subunit 2
MQEAISELGTPRVKVTKIVPSYKGLLTLGKPDSDNPNSVLSIYVERVPKIMSAKPKTASAFVSRSDLAAQDTGSSATVEADDGNEGDENKLTSVRSTYAYQIPDESAAGGKRDVGREELEKGYEYGRIAVHISVSDENVTKLETEASFEVIGFIPQNKVSFSSFVMPSN